MYFCVKPNPVLRFVGLGWALYRSFKQVVTAIECGISAVRKLRRGADACPIFDTRT